jgi:hypothetical protein
LKYRDFSTFSAQSYAIAAAKQLTMRVVATGVIVDPIAVADVKAVRGAIPPDRALHEAREDFGEALVELPGIDLGGHLANDADTALGAITGRAIGVLGVKAAQNAGSVQKVVHQPVNGDHSGSDFGPARPTSARAQQKIGQCHAEHLVGNAIDTAHRLEQGPSHGLEPIGSGRVVSGVELGVDPGYEIAPTTSRMNRNRL